MTPLAWLLIGIAVLLVISVIMSHNRFVRQRTLADESWGDIDVELSRRHDLIPNLVETVQGYATHEREVLEQLVRAREAAAAHRDDGPHAREGFEDSVTRALQSVLARVEAYPDLKASENFLDAAAPADPHRGPDRSGPALLQRQRALLQHPGSDVPVEPGRRWPSGSGGRTSSSSRTPLQHPCQVSIPLDDRVLQQPARCAAPPRRTMRDVRPADRCSPPGSDVQLAAGVTPPGARRSAAAPGRSHAVPSVSSLRR